jgi:hypothetical protein
MEGQQRATAVEIFQAIPLQFFNYPKFQNICRMVGDLRLALSPPPDVEDPIMKNLFLLLEVLCQRQFATNRMVVSNPRLKDQS